MTRVDRILEIIDNALGGDVGPDAMRWTPEPVEDELPEGSPGVVTFTISSLPEVDRARLSAFDQAVQRSIDEYASVLMREVFESQVLFYSVLRLNERTAQGRITDIADC